MRHGVRIAAWSLFFLGLVAGFIVWLVWTPLRTPVLVAVATNCDAPLPPNAWAQEDAERLQSLDREEVLKCSLIPWESKELGVAELRRELALAAPGGPHKNLVVLYLSMPGAVDGDAEPCLIPPGASPWKSDQWLRVRDLLQQLFPRDQSDKLSAQVKKLLILDATRMGSNWNLGLLYNSFAERLQAVLQDVNVPNLCVLNSTGPGQVGWAAPELKGSVFGYFLWQGLKGAADAEQSGDHDKVVSLQELRQYLKAHVGQWVTENRAAVQEPLLLPPEADFPIVFRHSSQATAVPAPSEPDPRWQQIGPLWEKHAELSRRTPYRTQPVAWEEFQQKLLRLEQLVEAGKAYEGEFGDARKQAESLAATLDRDPIGGDVAAYSLPLARQFRPWPSAAQFDALPAPWKKPPVKAAAKPAEKPSEKPAQEPAAAPPLPYPYLAASAAAWDWLLADPSRVGQLPGTLKFVDGAEQRPAHDLIEMHFSRMLAEHLDPPLWKSDPGPIHRALAVRRLAEAAAAPADARVLYWLQSLMEKADQLRRDAEDRLFVGSPAAVAEAEALWKNAAGDDGKGGAYAGVFRRTEELVRAFQARDRAWAEIPYLAQWILARQPPVGSADAGLRSAINDARELAAGLDEHLADRQWPPEAAALAARLDGRLQTLEKMVEEECSDLKTAGEDKQTLRRIAAVLTMPLPSGQERNWLRDRYLSIARKITPAGAQYEVAVEEKAAAENVDVAKQALERLQAWDEHPLALILDSGGATDTPPPTTTSAAEPRAGDGAESSRRLTAVGNREVLLKRLAQQGSDLRRRLSDLPETVQLRMRATTKLLDEKASQPAEVVRAGDGKADRLARAAAAFLDARLRGKLGAEPAGPLRRLDLHYLMLWQGNRTADDFWGPAPGRDEPYFAPVARAYGQAAEKLRKGVPRWEAAVDQLAQAARAGVQPAVDPKNVFVDQSDPAVRHAFSVTIPEHVPAGTAAIYLQDSAGLLPLLSTAQQPLRRMGIAVAEPGKRPTQEYWIPNDARLEKADRLQAVALYRGQVRWDDFYVPPSAGLDIVYTRPDYPKPTVVVRGELRQTTTVMFIFDCSGSMGTRQVVEGKETTRFDLARNTLGQILHRLMGPENPYHVGVMIYGHRVGWNPANPNEVVIRDPQNPRRFTARPPEMAQINPNNDVELALPPGPFGQNEFDEVSRRLAALHNLGETPLYLSITGAIRHLRSESGAGPRRIVVITDGVNEQSGGGPDVKYRADVEQELKKPGNENLRLDIVGFQLTAENESERQSLRDLQELTAATGGAFHRTQDPSALLTALQRSLKLSQYVVETLPAGRRVTPEPLELNTPCLLERPPPTGAGYRVLLIDPDHSAEARATVEGGEALELFVSRSGKQDEPRLVYHRYAKDLRDAVDKIRAPQDGQKRSFYLAAHLPEWKGTAARFFVSVQNADPEQFSPHPQEAWIQIRPVAGAGQTGAMEYAFYDMEFLPDCPVPVLACLAPNWPEKAKEAEIQVWCKLLKTPPDRDLTVSGFRQRKPLLEGAPQVAFEIDAVPGRAAGEPFRVVVTERHPAGSDLYSVKVEMQPAPEKAVHRYNVSAGVIRHTFYYENATPAEVEGYRVLLTARQKLVDEAIALPRPLKVTVPVD
jgi:Mg-chelatase subunit ChlD